MTNDPFNLKVTKITWTKEEGYLPDRAQYAGQGTLYIPNADPTDGGVYVCTATDGYSSFSDKKIIRVPGISRFYYNYNVL